MHAPPRDRLFVLLVLVEIGLGFVLASDDEHWMLTSLCLGLAAVLMSLCAHYVDDDRVEQAAALVWCLTLIVGVRWITVPAVAIPLALVTIVGVPIVIREEFRRRRAAIREARTRCVVCNYDLRATRERCPECGTHIDGEIERLRQIAAKMRARRAGQPIDDDYGREIEFKPPASSPMRSADASDGRR
jgi:hypothetical protein